MRIDEAKEKMTPEQVPLSSAITRTRRPSPRMRF